MESVSPVFFDSQELEKVYGASDGSDRYNHLPTFRTQYAVVSRWKLTEAEREYIANGGDLFIAIIARGESIQPIMPVAHPPEIALDIILKAEDQVMRHR